MIEQFIAYIESYTPIRREAKDELMRDCKIKRIEKGELLLSKEKICRHLYFMCDGVARSFYYLDGKDITNWIHVEYTLFTSWYSFLKQEPALEYIEAVSDLKVVTITYEKLQLLFEKHTDLATFGRLELQEQIALGDRMNNEFKFLTAKQKYDALLEMYPSITNIIKLGHIASLLGISQETLSRIRKLP